MKIIKKGIVKKNWWELLDIECFECGQVVNLEPVDSNREDWHRKDYNTICFECDCCGNMIKIAHRGKWSRYVS